MGGAARDFLVAEMRRRGAAVLPRQVELLGDLVVQRNDIGQAGGAGRAGAASYGRHRKRRLSSKL